MNVIGVAWFNRNIGFVLVKRTQVHKDESPYVAYIGVGLGFSEDYDIEQIMSYGDKFPVPIAIPLIQSYGTIKDPRTFNALIGKEIPEEKANPKKHPSK